MDPEALPPIILPGDKRKTPKAKRKPAKKPKTAKKKTVKAKRKPAKRTKAKKSKKPVRAIVRTERLDMRLSKAEKAKVTAVAKRRKQTITVVVYEAIARLK